MLVEAILPALGSFRDRVVVVTGASSGIGRETALLFARLGARVALWRAAASSSTRSPTRCATPAARHWSCRPTSATRGRRAPRSARAQRLETDRRAGEQRRRAAAGTGGADQAGRSRRHAARQPLRRVVHDPGGAARPARAAPAARSSTSPRWPVAAASRRSAATARPSSLSSGSPKRCAPRSTAHAARRPGAAGRGRDTDGGGTDPSALRGVAGAAEHAAGMGRRRGGDRRALPPASRSSVPPGAALLEKLGALMPSATDALIGWMREAGRLLGRATR